MNLSKLVVSSVACGAVWAGLASAQEAQVVQAQWQPQELQFSFNGFRTAYNCDGLEDRLEQIMRELGARPDVKVRATGCAPKQISSMITARINLNMPVEAGGATTAAAGASFPAQRKTVTLVTHDDGRQVGSGDCELLEQVRRQLLPALKLQVVKDELRCFPGADNLGNRALEIAALVPVQAKAK